MQTIYLSDTKIEQYPLFTNVWSTEAKIREFNEKELLKIFVCTTDNKLHTLELIEKHEQEFKMVKELLIFKKYIHNYEYEFVNGIVIDKGYPINLQDYSEKCSYQDLIAIFKRIGYLLKQLDELRMKEHILTDFFIGDFHERNILVDEISKDIQIIDLDSCKIGDNRAILAKYLQFIPTGLYVEQYLSNKYPIDNFHFTNNHNTDIFCYMAMIAKYLLGFSLVNLYIDAYYKKMYELKMNGLPEPIYQAFLALYNTRDNINPYQYLDDIPEFFESLHK